MIKETDSEIIDSDEDQPIPSSTKELLFGFFFIFIYSLLHIATMMLIMTYNGYVIIFVIIGLALGYIFFGMDCDKDKNVPVNCCAWYDKINKYYEILFLFIKIINGDEF